MSNTAASRLVLAPYAEGTVTQAARSALAEVGGRASIAFVFASLEYQADLPDFLELIQLHAHAPIVVGCSGSGLIGPDQESEQSGGFTLLLLHLPDTRLHVCELDASQAEDVESPEGWRKLTGVRPEEVDAWLVLADPFLFPTESWLARWNASYPGIPTIGGLCSSSGGGQDDVFVFHNRTVLAPGAALLIGVQGGVTIRTLVSQGCRPIGESLTVTGADGNLVLGLGGKPAYSALAEAFDSLTDEDKSRAQGNLFAGLASSEYLEDYKRGDFLIRTILGADASSGAVALGAYPRVGQTLQWQLRDRTSADLDLRERLVIEKRQTPRPFASLVFACNGRGTDLFGAPNHDAHILAQVIGKVPSAGLFCNGEIGPVGRASFVHGYTVAMALFA